MVSEVVQTKFQLNHTNCYFYEKMRTVIFFLVPGGPSRNNINFYWKRKKIPLD